MENTLGQGESCDSISAYLERELNRTGFGVRITLEFICTC